MTDGKAPPAPWEWTEAKYRMPAEDGIRDLRSYERRPGIDSADQQF